MKKLWYHLDVDMNIYETSGILNNIGVPILCSVSQEVLLHKYNREPVFDPQSSEIEMKIRHAYYQKFLDLTGRKYRCNECGEKTPWQSDEGICGDCLSEKVRELEATVRELRGVSND